MSDFTIGTLDPELQRRCGFSGCRGFRVAAVLPKARTSVAPGWLKDKDPLVIEAQGTRYPGEPISRYFDDEHEAWRQRAARDPEEAGLFVLPLAPDQLIKENVSGGPPYGLILPDSSADGLFAAETTMPFVSYLNHAFSRGGFPGQTFPHNQWQLKKALAQDLLPL